MTTPLTLFEHEVKSFEWTDRDCARLEQMRNSLGTEVLRATVRNGKKVIQAMRLASRPTSIFWAQ